MNTQQIETDKLVLFGWIYNIQDFSIIKKLKEFQNNALGDK